jgi:hypothetical protein
MNILFYNSRASRFISDPAFIRSKLNAEQWNHISMLIQSLLFVGSINDLPVIPGGFKKEMIHEREFWSSSVDEEYQLYFLPININPYQQLTTVSMSDVLFTPFTNYNTIIIFGRFQQKQFEIWVSKLLLKPQNVHYDTILQTGTTGSSGQTVRKKVAGAGYGS